VKNALFFICLTLPFSTFAYSLNCAQQFNLEFHKKSFKEKVKLVRSLKKRQLKCLYDSAKKRPSPTMDFFDHVFKAPLKRVQRFIGKNGLGIYNKFEKHFFTVKTPDGPVLYGYNQSPASWFAGPGFFRVDTTPSGQMVFDYRLNFKKLIPRKQFRQWKGRTFKQVKNNHRSVVYGGGLLDDCYQLNKEILVLKAYKISKRSGKKRTFTYDAILKVPACKGSSCDQRQGRQKTLF